MTSSTEGEAPVSVEPTVGWWRYLGINRGVTAPNIKLQIQPPNTVLNCQERGNDRQLNKAYKRNTVQYV